VNGLWTDEMAIIMGDYLYAQSMAILVRHKLSVGMEVMARVVEAFGETVFDTVINRTVRFPETTVAGEPITTWAPKSAGAAAYRQLAREVIAR